MSMGIDCMVLHCTVLHYLVINVVRDRGPSVGSTGRIPLHCCCQDLRGGEESEERKERKAREERRSLKSEYGDSLDEVKIREERREGRLRDCKRRE